MGKGKSVTSDQARLIYQTYLTGPKGAAKNLCRTMGYSERTYYKIINAEGEINPKYFSPKKSGVKTKLIK